MKLDQGGSWLRVTQIVTTAAEHPRNIVTSHPRYSAIIDYIKSIHHFSYTNKFIRRVATASNVLEIALFHQHGDRHIEQRLASSNLI
jgi:hypothetical protein